MKNIILYASQDILFQAVSKLEQKKLVRIVNVFSEYKLNHPQYIDKGIFFDYLISDKYDDLIKESIKDMYFDEQIYDKVYSHINEIIELINRLDLYQIQQTHNAINQFNIWYRFFYSIFKKNNIDYIIFENYPHSGVSIVLYYLAKYLGIKTIFLKQELEIETNTPIISYFYDLSDFGVYKDMQRKYRESRIILDKEFKKKLSYMKNLNSYDCYKINNSKHTTLAFISRFAAKLTKKVLLNKKSYRKVEHYIPAKIRQLCLQYKYVNNLKKTISINFSFNQKFVYFPLHLQPELTTCPLAGIYNDQLLAIERLSQIIPKDWYIYVKENPKQTEFQRPASFFKRLKLINNVILVPASVDTYDLIQNAQFVATPTGTAAYESITGGKPAMIFGKAWWSNLPGIFKYHEKFDINELLNYKINFCDLEYKINDFYSKCIIGVLDDHRLKKLIPNFSIEKNINNLENLLITLLK